LKAAADTFPKTPFYDIQQTLTSLGIGEALVTVLSPNGVPTPPFATRIIPPATRMGPLTDAEFAQYVSSSAQVKEYAQTIDRNSAREMLGSRMVQAPPQEVVASHAMMGGRAPPSTMEQILRSPATKAVATTVVRGLFGALVGSPPRRRRSYF